MIHNVNTSKMNDNLSIKHIDNYGIDLTIVSNTMGHGGGGINADISSQCQPCNIVGWFT